MSQAALTLAARDILQAAFTWTAATCQLQFDGMPPPIAGELFVAVHPGEWRAIDCEGLAETFGFQVTVTKRAAAVPDDEGAIQIWSAQTVGLDAICRKIVTALHLDKNADALINAANAYLLAWNGNTPINGFVVPPRLRDGGRPMIKGAEWFHAETEESSGRFGNAGIAQTITFGGAERYQTIESMT